MNSRSRRNDQPFCPNTCIPVVPLTKPPVGLENSILSKQRAVPSSRKTLISDHDVNILLDKLGICIRPQGFLVATIATDDKRFLQYDARHDVVSKDTTALGKSLDLITALLNRLQYCFVNVAACPTDSADTVGQSSRANSSCQRAIANLEHMLRTLQHAALEALAYYYLKVVEAEFGHWYSHWQQRWQTGDAWFTEWPSGRRPLNTTWPWDVRTSLLVLWGVCWMFYGSGGVPRKPEAAEFLSAEFRRPRRSTPQVNFPATTSHSDVWTTPGVSHLQYPAESHRPVAPVEPRHANRISEYYSSSPYISTSPSTSSTSFATPSDFWPQNQGINVVSGYTYPPAYNLDTSPRLQIEQIPSIPAVAQVLEPPNQVDLYAAQYNQAITNEPRGQLAESGLSLGQPYSNMPGYPSPHSDMSDQRVSPRPPVFPATSMTPTTVPYTTTSRASSTYGSPQSAKSEEPTRNEDGAMYCKHKSCVDKPEGPPTFTRKCEWSKHMDKHTRPYICEERGCEKILGFTYSGGLLRHQREVHHQHGGPKVSCMCPHRDCKRSTGTGFSRRENLTEHLRRVHRGVGDDGTETPLVAGQRERKRRRAPAEDEVEENDDVPEESKRRKTVEDDGAVEKKPKTDELKDLQAQVKQLELELQQKDERLQKLEDTVTRLVRGQ